MVAVSFTFSNLRPGFVSAWDATKINYDRVWGTGAFDSLRRADQISEVRAYVNR